MDTLHIDGDILAYRVGFACQRTVYILDVEGEHTCSPILITKSKVEVNKWLKACPDLLVTELFYVENAIQAAATLQLFIQNIVKGAQAKAFKVVVSGEDNFREKIATIQPYKGNRKGSTKPVHWQMLRDWLIEKPYTIVSVNEEADDILSKECMKGNTIATIDKDLDNTPGWHYNFNKEPKSAKYYVSETDAAFNFYRQCLTGDKADNIPGVKGIGPKTADALFATCTTREQYEDIILQQYEKVYPKPLDALTEIGQLLWMRRRDNEMYFPVHYGGVRVMEEVA